MTITSLIQLLVLCSVYFLSWDGRQCFIILYMYPIYFYLRNRTVPACVCVDIKTMSYFSSRKRTLQILHMVPQSLSSYGCQSCFLQKALFPWCLSFPSGSSNLSVSSSAVFWALKGGLDEDIPRGLIKCSLHCLIVSLCICTHLLQG